MASATFSGRSDYRLDVQANLSGRDIYVDVWVVRTGSYTAWSTAQQAWSVNIDGQVSQLTWTYDFRNTTSTYLGRVWRYGNSSGGKYVAVGVNMASGIGSASLQLNITVPYDAPATPTIQSVVRNSDTSQTINWTRHASGNAPYAYQAVQWSGHQLVNGTWQWSEWANLVILNQGYTDTAAMSYTDTRTIANNLYRYRIVAVNSTASAVSGATGFVATTPAAPSNVTLTLLAGQQTRVDITASNIPHTEYKTEIQYSSGGGTWTALTTLARGASLTYTWTPPAGANIRVRARMVVDNASQVSAGNGLAGAYKESNLVPLQSAPAAPSSLAPSGYNVDRAQAQRFTWQHNPTDTSAQSAYELRYQLSSADPTTGTWTTTGKITSTNSYRDFAANFLSAGEYRWQVRTYGVHADPSPWSASAIFGYRDAGVTTITVPQGTSETAYVNAAWTTSTTQASWQGELTQDGETREQRTGTGNAEKSTQFTTLLTNGATYTLRVRYNDANGLWSPWAASTFLVNFPLPGVPTAIAQWDTEQGAVILTIDNSASGETAAAYNKIYRRYDGQSWTLVSNAVARNAIVADREVKLNDRVEYKVVAFTDLDTTAESTIIPVFTTVSMGYWSSGPNFSVTMQVKMDLGSRPAFNMQRGLTSKSLHYFAGRKLPVEFAGSATKTTADISFTVDSVEDRDEILQLATLPAPHLLRHQDGTVMYASIDDVNLKRVLRGIYQVSVSFTEVQR